MFWASGPAILSKSSYIIKPRSQFFSQAFQRRPTGFFSNLPPTLSLFSMKMLKRQRFVRCKNADQPPSSKLRKTEKGFEKSAAKGSRKVIVDIGEFNEESDEDSELEKAEVAYREPAVYDELLKQLGTRNNSVAIALKRRQQEEQGNSDTDGDSSSENISESEESDDGSDTKSPVDFGNGHKGVTEIEEDNGEDADNDAGDDALSESDEGENGLPFLDESVIESSFDRHFSYKLASSKVDDLLKRKWRYAWKMPAPNLSNCNWRGTGECFMEGLDMNSFVGLKPRLYRNWLEVSKSSGSSKSYQSSRSLFFSICSSYYDILHHNKKPFYLKGLEEDSSVMDAYLLHCLNHIFRSRDLMAKNERKLSTKETLDGGSYDGGDAYLDRGFTRPKVLILLPLAGIARRIVKRLIDLTPPKHKASVENLKRFYEEFGSGKIDSREEHEEGEVAKLKKSNKPPDFEALLGRDNDNDHFMIGIKFTNRGVKLYGDFYTSDVIVASPLGLITKIGEAEVEKEKDVDYLSSIEILIIDHADVMLMQNWSHVNTVVEQLNRLPSKQHGIDIMRIRPWYLDGQAQFYRQTIILSSHIHPEINVMFARHCLNHKGKVKLECKYKGVLPKILTQVRQIYERFDTESIAEADDARLKYFCEKVFPTIKDSVQNGVMIFISSYFEFVRLRNYLKSQAASFCLFGEYIKRNDISHVRGQFFRGERKIMLYTERAHFYYRYKIRGVQNLIIYSLPERKEFYPEIVNFLEESDNMNCRVLFSRLDNLRLERIVGSAAAKRMIDSEKGVFVFA